MPKGRKEVLKMKKYEMMLKMLDAIYNRIKESDLIAYSEKPYVMYIEVMKMEKNYKSEFDSMIFHEALRNWMCKHIFMYDCKD